MMEKILILANNDIGLYRFRKELITELIHRENEVHISLPKGEYVPKLEAEGCIYHETEVDRRGLNPFKDIELLRRYFQIIKEVKPSLVVTYTIKPNVYGGIVCRMLKVPYAINITGLGTTFQNDGLLKKFVVFLYKTACKAAKIVFFENEGNRDTFLQEKILKREKTHLLYGAGVNLEEFKYADYPTDEEPIRFLFLGRIMKEKGVDELFYAARKVKEELGDKVQFDVVGFFEDAYKVIVEEMSKDGIINYHGYQTDVVSFYKQTHCLVLPSYHEGMSNVLLEAAAIGRPLITTDIHGCKEAVDDGVSGFLCEVKNQESLYEKIVEFVCLSYEEKKEYGVHARQKMEMTFDKRKVVEETIFELMK